MSEEFDVVVIGGGTAGLVTASGCARLGRRVALIERESLGGDCLWTGCVPTKALVATARLAHQMRHADSYGLERVDTAISPRRVMDSMRAARREIEPNDAPEKFRALGIEIIEGSASFQQRNRVAVGSRLLSAKDIVIATGSRTSVPPIDGLADTGYLDHVSFLAHDSFPRSLLMLGGGYIGVEFAQLLGRFGCSVTIIEAAPTLVPNEDADVVRAVTELLESEGISIRTGARVIGAKRHGGEKSLIVIGPDGAEEEIRAEEIFLATGRRGNVEGLGLDAAGVRVERNYVVVDEYLATTAPGVWAAGDIHGGLQFTHVAAYDAVKVVRNMLFPGKSAVRYDNIPMALYTDPEIAHVGETERTASARLGEQNVRSYVVPMHDVDRAIVDRTSRGLLKVVCDARGHILGAHAVCSGASTLIQHFVLARARKMKIGELGRIVSPYPSMADSAGKAATAYYQQLGNSWLGRLAKKVAGWSQ